MSFGEKLRNLRNERGLTQAQLGQHLSLSESTISLYESERRSPDREKLKRIANFFNVTVDYLIDTDIREVDILDALEGNKTQLLAGGQPLTPEQRLGVMQILDNPSLLLTNKHTIPLLGTIRAGIPLLSGQNIIGSIDIPADLVGIADFALIVKGDSMIGAGINDGDIAVCKEDKDAISGQIVVALVNNDETTLKYYIRDNGQSLLRAANPEYKDIVLKSGDKVQGHVVKILKDPPSVNLYREYIYFKEGHLQEWNEVIEKATAAGIKPLVIREMINAQLEIAKRLTGK